MKKIIFIVVVIFVASVSVFAQRQWTKNGGVNIAASSAAIPAFPRLLSGFRPAGKSKDYWDNELSEDFKLKGTIRVHEGGDWDGIYEFPYTMNSCSAGVFMIRWRSANPDVLVESTVAHSPETASRGKTGKFGYMYGTNCEQPLFKFGRALNGNESNLVDIYYELKFWQAAP